MFCVFNRSSNVITGSSNHKAKLSQESKYASARIVPPWEARSAMLLRSANFMVQRTQDRYFNNLLRNESKRP